MTASDETCSQEEYDEKIDRIQPPSPTLRELENPILLILQTIFLFMISVPVIIWSFIEEQFIVKKKSLKGKNVLVTGSGRGLGQGFALKLAKLGCNVACVDIDESINKETVDMINEMYPGKAKGYVCNVGLSCEIRAMKEAIKKDFGDIDILLHNAGLLAGAPITEFDDVYVHGVIAINLTSHFFLIREFLPDMIKKNEGHIVAVASIAGFGGLANASMYSATKHGVLGLMECLHYELQENPINNVQTSVICPYFINTSAFYSKFWNLRIPELSIQEVVDAAVYSIRKNKRVITIPSYMYYALHLLKFFPDKLNKIIRHIFHLKLTIPPKKLQYNTPVFKLLMSSMKNIDLGFDQTLPNPAA